VSRRSAAQQRALATRVDGRQVPGFNFWRAMPDEIDPRILAKQHPLVQPSLYPSRRYADAQQLRPRDDSVLRLGDTRDFLLRRPALDSHTNL
jgi:hypothetical protein